MTHRFRDGFRAPKGVSADTVAAELSRIAERDGDLKPEAVVDESRPKNAPLHPAFEWHDKTAAEAWRVHQARNIIRSVVVVNPADPREAPVFVNVKAVSVDEPSYYQKASVVVQSVDETARALAVLTEKLMGAERALTEFQRLAGTRGDSTVALVALAASSLAAARDAIARIQ